MGCWFGLLVTSLGGSAYGAPSDSPEERIRNVSLISVKRYDPSRAGSFTRAMKAAGSSVLSTTVGTIVVNYVDLKEALSAKLKENKELSGYFSDSEQENLAARVAKKVESEVGGVVSNADAVRAIRSSGTTLLEAITDRVLQKEGVNSTAARQAWSRKIARAFDSCGQKSKTYFEAQGCLDSAVASVSQNIGLAMVYEMTAQELVPSLRESPVAQTLPTELDKKYRSCKGLLGNEGGVKDCVLRTMRIGVSTVTDLVLRKSLAPHFRGAELEKVRAAGWNPFQACLGKSTAGNAIRQCIDRLAIDTGAASVEEKARTETAVVEIFPDASRRAELAREKKAVFLGCAENALKKDLRRNGVLDIDGCQNTVENQLTYTVLLHAFRSSVAESLGGGDSQLNAVVSRGKEALDRCWRDDQDAAKRTSCVRGAVVALAHATSQRNLERDMPAKLLQDDPSLKASLLDEYDRCLDKELPADLVKSPERGKKLDHCSGDLRRKAALHSAEFKVRNAFAAKMQKADLDSLVQAKVHGEFARCLGRTPAQGELRSCGVVLTREAAKLAGAILIPTEVRTFLAKSQKALSLEENQAIDRFLQKNVLELQACLDRDVTLARSEQSDALAEGCFKESIRETVLFLARTKFDSDTAKLYSSEKSPQRDGMRDRFLAQLGTCIGPKGAREASSIDEFLSRSYRCADEGAQSVTREVARDQVSFAIEQYAPGNDKLRKDLLAGFDGCMAGLPKQSSDENKLKCQEELQRSATRDIGITAARIQVSAQLGSGSEPQALSKIERDFRGCVASANGGAKLSGELDSCLKRYTIDLSAAVGEVKLRQALRENLGSKDYARIESEANASSERFKSCLRSLEALPMGKAVLDGVQACASELQDSARRIVKGKLKEWLQVKDSPTVPGDLAKSLLASSLPCLDGLMADQGSRNGPEGQVEAAGVDAEGTLEALVALLKDYIEYDAAKADADIPAILSALQKDLASVTPFDARKRLVQLLVEKGALDQLVKATVRSSVSKALLGLPADQRFSVDVTARVLEKETFDAIFATSKGKRILEKTLAGVIWPVLGEGRQMKGAQVASMQDSIRKDVTELLVESPQFGSVLISESIQKQMNDMGFASRFFARMLYGADSLKWERLRTTDKGRAAEAYIRDAILRPKMMNDSVSPQEEQRRLKQARDLVTQAVKSYSTKN